MKLDKLYSHIMLEDYVDKVFNIYKLFKYNKKLTVKLNTLDDLITFISDKYMYLCDIYGYEKTWLNVEYEIKNDDSRFYILHNYKILNFKILGSLTNDTILLGCSCDSNTEKYIVIALNIITFNRLIRLENKARKHNGICTL